MLIVEDDADFARTELEIARERGFKGLVALRGDTGLALAREFRPDAIVLDMSLPVLDGWTLLDRLKRHPSTRHIPVHIVSGVEELQPALLAGAAAFVEKPASLERSRASSAGSSRSSTATSAGCWSSTTTRRSGKRSSSSSAATATSRSSPSGRPRRRSPRSTRSPSSTAWCST